MSTRTIFIKIITASIIALFPLSASAMNLSDGIFSWPSNYDRQEVPQNRTVKAQKLGLKTTTLGIKKPATKETKNKKRK